MELKFTVEQLNKLLEILSELPIKHGAIFEQVKKHIESVTIPQMRPPEKKEE